MAFDPLMAVTRFGAGVSPFFALPQGMGEVLDEARSDAFDTDYPFLTFEEVKAAQQARHRLRRDAGRLPDGAEKEALEAEARAIAIETRIQGRQDFVDEITRYVGASYGMRERLVAFWEDHFATRIGGVVMQHSVASIAGQAIRPHLFGSFAQMLKAVVRHPIMLLFLDQARSVGPNSRVGRRSPGRGLNENLARELLELHTLGVGGPYSQADVRELAELLTGLTVGGDGDERSFFFRRGLEEPGAETVLGRTYDQGGIEAIDAVLDDLARHPVTAAHLARKLAVHFVSDAPSEALVAHMTARFMESDANLGALVEAMVEHPDAWSGPGNVKRSLEFVLSSLRAVGLSPADMESLDHDRLWTLVAHQTRSMGQWWKLPPDPAGWPEEDEAWITPQALAARINWAMEVPDRIVGRLPDPRDLLTLVSNGAPPRALEFAVGAAENEREGVGLVLVSPLFQRR